MLHYSFLTLSVALLALAFALVFGLGPGERPAGCTGACPDVCGIENNCMCACPK